MKRLSKLAAGVAASLALGVAALPAHAHSGAMGATGGMGPGMMGQGHQMRAAQQDRMGSGHQRHAAAGSRHGASAPQQHGGSGASGCPMAAPQSAPGTHNH